MNEPTPAESASKNLEENLKKALTEFIMLSLLAERECYIGQMTAMIEERSEGKLSLVFPYAAVYRLLDSGHIADVGKRFAPDGRRRQYYSITDSGRAYLCTLQRTCDNFFASMRAILAPKEEDT